MLKKIVTVVALSAAFSAQADTFEYSYTFKSGKSVSGSFDGIQNGDLVTGLYKISARYAGVNFIGTGNLYGHSAGIKSDGSFGYVVGGAIASFSGTASNFLFIDMAVPSPANYSGYNNYFFINPNPETGISEHWGALTKNPFSISDEFDSGAWSLKNVTAVPEPATYAMLIAGLYAISAAARRRKKRSTAW